MEKNLLIFAALVFIICGCIYWFKPVKEVQAQQQQVGKSDFGIMYIDTDSVDIVKKDNMYYLIVSAEEVYTDEQFLQKLRQSEEMKEAVSVMNLYMFTNDGRFYCTPQRYAVDKNGKVCANLGSDMQMKPIEEKILLDVYTNALKILEDKQRFQSMVNK